MTRAKATMGTISSTDRQKAQDSTGAAAEYCLNAASTVSTVAGPLGIPVAIGMLVAGAGAAVAKVAVSALPGDEEE